MKKIVLATVFTIGAFYVQAQNHDLPPADQRAKRCAVVIGECPIQHG